MLFITLDLSPGLGGQGLIQSRQHHQPTRGGGDDRQQVGSRRGGACRPSGDQGVQGRGGGPAVAQSTQQTHAALIDVHEPQLTQPPRPVGQHPGQQGRGAVPMLGQFALNQGLDPPGGIDLLDL